MPIPADAYAFAVKRLSRPSKTHLRTVTAALKDVNGKDFVNLAEEWLKKSGYQNLTVGAVMELCYWLRTYTLKDIYDGMERAFQRAGEPGGPAIYGPGFVKLFIHQTANSELNRQLRVGRGPQPGDPPPAERFEP